MIDKNTVVDLPKAPHKIKLVHAKSGVTYVQLETGRVYDKVKKYNLPLRVSIGKLCDFDKSKMYPNPKYYELLNQEAAKPQVARPVLPISNNALLETQPETTCSRLLSVGPYLVIKQAADDLQLESLLKQSIDEAGLEGLVISDSILDVAVYSIVSQANGNQSFEEYAHEHYLFSPEQRILSGTSVSRLLPNINEDLQLEFFNKWNRQHADCDEVLISYVSTNKNAKAGDIEIIELGQAKVDMGAPLYNIAMASSLNGCIPLLFEVYDGSIPDVSQLQNFIAKLHAYGYKNVTLVLDRGNFSAKNFELIDETDFNFIMMVKGSKPMLSSLIAEYGNSIITDPTYSIQAGRKFCGRTIEQEFLGKKRYFHLCFSLEKCTQETNALEKELQQQIQILKAHEKQLVEIVDPAMLENFAITYSEDGKTFLYATEKTDVINDKYSKCGYFCIITSKHMTAAEAYRDYMYRATPEKLVPASRAYLYEKTARLPSQRQQSALMGFIFVLFIALILRSRLYMLIKDEPIRKEKTLQHLTVPQAIDELDRLQIIQPRVQKPYVQANAISAKAQQLLGCFGISPAEAKERIAALCTNEALYKKASATTSSTTATHAATDNNAYASSLFDDDDLSIDANEYEDVDADSNTDPNADAEIAAMFAALRALF